MSTNYYAFGPFPGGEPDGEGLHIGQTAAGWRFLFRAHPDLGLTSAAAWNAFLHRGATMIRDEYGVTYAPGEMNEIATRLEYDEEKFPLQPRYRNGPRRPGEFVDPVGHAFYEGEFS